MLVRDPRAAGQPPAQCPRFAARFGKRRRDGGRRTFGSLTNRHEEGIESGTFSDLGEFSDRYQDLHWTRESTMFGTNGLWCEVYTVQRKSAHQAAAESRVSTLEFDPAVTKAKGPSVKIRPSQSSRGFTLLEIMVCFVPAGLVVAAIYSSWMAMMRGTRSGLKAAAEVQRSRMALQTMEIALSSARSFEGDREYYTFEAENGSKAYAEFCGESAEIISAQRQVWRSVRSPAHLCGGAGAGDGSGRRTGPAAKFDVDGLGH